MSRYQAIVFDKDGTLIDVHLTWGPVFAQVIPAVAGDAAEEAAAALALDLDTATMREESVVIAGSNAEIAHVVGRVMGAPPESVLAAIEPMIDDLAAGTRHPSPRPRRSSPRSPPKGSGRVSPPTTALSPPNANSSISAGEITSRA